MPPRRFAAVPLPKGVFRITRGRKVYFYHQSNRHKPKAERGMLTRIPYEPSHPEFWNMAGELNGAVAASSAGTFKTLIKAYKASPAWAGHSDGTRETYTIYLARVEDAWGSLQVADLGVRGVTALRDEIAASTPSAANMMLKVLKAFLSWAVDRGEVARNVARDAKAVTVTVQKTTPWPEEVWQDAYANGPLVISRLAFLGRKAGQRISDMVRMGEHTLKGDSLHFQIKKRRMKDHVVALQPEDAAVIRKWKGIWFPRASGEPHTEDSLRDELKVWLAERKWAGRAKPHGLRALAVCDARMDGLADQEIANLFGMSTQMVASYSSLINVEAVGKASQSRRAAAKNSAKAEN
jgi:hypothetical protein